MLGRPMTNVYRNRDGAAYYLPEFGPPVRWLSCVLAPPHKADRPVIFYFECDAENLCCRAIHIFDSGRAVLAFPGGPDGDLLPEGPLPPVGATKLPGMESREVTMDEFSAVWAALSRALSPDSQSP